MTASSKGSSDEYYKLNVAQLPDELYHEKVPAKEWLKHATSTTKEGFAPNSLNQLHPVAWDVQMERFVGISLYMVTNILPFILPILCVSVWFSFKAKAILYFVIVYVGILYIILCFFFQPRFEKKYNRPLKMSDNIKDNQYLYTERNITKYLSVNFVWPKSMQRPNMEQTPVIFCAIPHGVAPFGITAYPLWSKLWNDKLCHWTCAPIVLKIPFVSYFMSKIGYVEAKSKNILEVLTKKEENVGVVLDGIDGMFQNHGGKNAEIAYLKKRKGIVKIALRAGAPIVPVYGFGHTSLYTVVVDPFGILEWLSHRFQTSFTPFFGRFGWFLGPPKRRAVTVCIGEPVVCPRVDEPTMEQVDEYHAKMLAAYQQVFETHKVAYGWGHKTLKMV